MHRWLSTDTEEYVTCYVCGVLATDTDPGNASSDIVGRDGEPIIACHEAAGHHHHYPGECPEFDEPCTRNQDCNCHFCG